ncbi:hypothetical protein JFPO14_contig00008-0001 [Edwardsiella piscicida]|nr:hypothetical protein JFPO14_contig00008-0001 [Edwardsiella piscicida]
MTRSLNAVSGILRFDIWWQTTGFWMEACAIISSSVSGFWRFP